MTSHTQASHSTETEVVRVLPGEWKEHPELAEEFAGRMLKFDEQWDDIASSHAKELMTGVLFGNSVFYFFGDWCVYFTDVMQGATASMHFIGMKDDAKFEKDTIRTTKAIVRDMFKDYSLARISTIAPDWLYTDRAAKLIGMTYEGRMRSCLLYQGVWKDAHLLSFIRKDMNNE